MLTIQPNFTSPNYSRQNFNGGHLPKHFSSMMNNIYKKMSKQPDLFEHRNFMEVSTVMKDGQEVSGIVRFHGGRFQSLEMEEGCENLRQEFMRTALDRYNNKIASARVREKLFQEKLARHRKK